MNGNIKTYFWFYFVNQMAATHTHTFISHMNGFIRSVSTYDSMLCTHKLRKMAKQASGNKEKKNTYSFACLMPHKIKQEKPSFKLR